MCERFYKKIQKNRTEPIFQLFMPLHSKKITKRWSKLISNVLIFPAVSETCLSDSASLQPTGFESAVQPCGLICCLRQHGHGEINHACLCVSETLHSRYMATVDCCHVTYRILYFSLFFCLSIYYALFYHHFIGLCFNFCCEALTLF